MGKHVALYSVPRVPKQYTSSIQAVPRLVAQDLHKEWPSSTSAVYKECPTAVAPVYKKWPSSSSSVQVMSKLVHMLCTNWALAWARVHFQAVSKLGHSKCYSLDTACSHL